MVPENRERIAASIIGVGKQFAAKKATTSALTGIDLEIAEGEYVVVLGPSGCGKTTLLRCIAGLEAPSAGRISLRDRVVYDAEGDVDVKPNKRDVGLLFQSYALWPHMTVHKNVSFPLRMRKVRRERRRPLVDAVLAAVECLPLAKRLPAELSGGQQQRVALARALVAEPTILLLDEPLSNLDALLRISLRAELLRLHRELGFTAIHITHDQEEALEMGDRVVLMREGRIEQMGPPKEVYNRPISPYAANFLGVRNQLAVTSEGGLLRFGDEVIHGSENYASVSNAEVELKLFARDHDVRLYPAGVHTALGDDLALTGTLQQIVLGPAGKPRYIVDVAGRAWYAANASDPGVLPGTEVVLGINRQNALLYAGDRLIGSTDAEIRASAAPRDQKSRV